jgi:hypothetical protein
MQDQLNRVSRRAARGGIVVVAGLIGIQAAEAATYRVDKDSTFATPDGSTWQRAYRNPQDALAVAGDGDVIWVADGTYKPTSGSDQSISFLIDDDIRMYGGFQGISNPSGPSTENGLEDRNPLANITILSGDIDNDGLDSGNSWHVVKVSGTGASSAVDGFTITGGYADDTGTHEHGGGMHVTDSAVCIAKCRFQSNRADKHGAALFIDGNSLFEGETDVFNCVFTDNGSTTTIRGGAIFTLGNGPTIMNCLMYENTAKEGAGVYAYDTGAFIVNCTVAYNTAAGSSASQGGGIWIGGNHLDRIHNCIVWGNTAVIGSTEEEQIFEYIPETSQTPEVKASIIEGCDVFCEEPTDGNSGSDPDFVSVASDNYRVDEGSPAIDAADASLLPDDLCDVDQDGTTGEDTPVDLVLKDRDVGEGVDKGAYEFRPCPADLDGDGSVDDDDLDILLDAWGNPGCGGTIPCAADLDDNGKVDVDDQLILLNAWGSCPS